MNRLNVVMALNHIAFMERRQILDGLLVANELLHSRRKERMVFVFKVDL